MIRLFVILAFFVSGASSLMLEVVWSKALGHIVGNTLQAITTVVASYMGGLALGAAWAGRSGLGHKRPVLAYGVLEIGIGLFGIASPFLIKALDGPLGAAYVTFGGTSAAYAVIRFLVTFGLLLVPTTMMGATLPILVSWGTRRADLARVLGTLYAVNTAGAVVGTVLAGFAFLPTLGLSRTALVAGLTSLTLGAIMATLDRRLPAATVGATPAPAPPPAAAAPKTHVVQDPAERPRLMLFLFALSGAVSLSTQIAWSRVAAILLGSSVYSFTLVLATFLVGIAAGAALVVPWIVRRGATWRLFAVLQWIAAAGILYASVRIADAPWSLLANVVAANGRVKWLWIQEVFLLAGFMLPACLAFGAIFPVATRLSALPGDTPSHTTGRAYGWNTFGTITGSLLAGFLLVRVLGMRGTLLAVAATALLVGLVAWFAAPRATPKKRSSIPEGAPIATLAVPALIVATFVLAAFLAPPWNRGLLAMGVFRPLVAGNAQQAMTPAAARQSLRDQMAMEEVVSFAEGGSATVSVHRTKTNPPIIAIRVNGKTDASTSLDMKTQMLAAHLALLWAPDSARVAVVGYGSGVTVGSALTHPLKSLDCIEIEPAVLAADPWFRPYNNDPTSDPRLRIHIEDGRTFIARSTEPYDVIISEPSNPWLAGVNNLFTVDYYRLVEGSLAPEGVFCQWVQLYEMSGVTVASLMRSLGQVFPRAQVFLSNRDLLIVATREGRPLDLAQVSARLARPQVARDLARAEVNTAADLLALRLSGLSGLIARLPAAPLNEDDRPFVEYRAPVDFYEVRPSDLPFSQQLVQGDDPVADLATWTVGPSPVDLAADVTHALMARGDLARANVWLRALMAKDPSRAEPLIASLEQAARRRDRELQITQARQALEVDDRLTARRLLDALLRDHPDDGTALVERARLSMREDSIAPARRLLARAERVGTDDDRYQAALNVGILEMREGRAAEGLARFEHAAALRPAELNGWLYQARALVGLGRTNEAILLLGRAQATVADSTGLRTALQQLTTTGTLQ